MPTSLLRPRLLVAAASTAGALFLGTHVLAQNASTADTVSSLPIPTAICFPVVFDAPIDIKRSHDKDAIEASLKEDLLIDGEVVASAGSAITGHIQVLTEKSPASARLKGTLPAHKVHKLLFDEIILTSGETIKIIGAASVQKKQIVSNGVTRVLSIKQGGRLEDVHFVTTPNKIIAAAGSLTHRERTRAQTEIEAGDELYVQAHSPYDSGSAEP